VHPFSTESWGRGQGKIINRPMAAIAHQSSTKRDRPRLRRWTILKPGGGGGGTKRIEKVAGQMQAACVTREPATGDEIKQRPASPEDSVNENCFGGLEKNKRASERTTGAQGRSHP